MAILTIKDGSHLQQVLEQLRKIKGRRNNPVHFADSIDALDLISESLRLLRLGLEAGPDFLDRLREQILRHRRALRTIIGTEGV